MSIAMRDTFRQILALVGAVVQVVFAAYSPSGIGIAEVSARNPTLSVPADFAFTIWGPIFTLVLIVAVWEALPAQRTNQALRRVGPWLTAACFANAAWEVIFPSQLFVLSQITIFGILACLGVAFFRAARTDLNRTERLLIGPTLGIFFGWISAASLVNVAITLAGTRTLMAGMGQAQAILSNVLIVSCTIFAVIILVASKAGPRLLTLFYGLTIIWGISGIAVNNAATARSIGITAVVAIVVVVAILVLNLFGGDRQRGQNAPLMQRA